MKCGIAEFRGDLPHPQPFSSKRRELNRLSALSKGEGRFGNSYLPLAMPEMLVEAKEWEIDPHIAVLNDL